ncbi:STAS-like domain-containing protein [Mesorhizobium sangaii]|uniref:DUF4325 domain-containing protein n=1 Tax=Mesorhizobium sangaii TaxID=505389 RepID=A0A841P475_9HYPH|nr:STAS-like domain-containing protein [Mesorhizobium sangaii]MBB6407668.1 hypothetical protein [Mesorhizobium sangaii]
MALVNIPISSIVGSGICVSASDGQKVYAILQSVVVRGDRAQLSFSGITRMTTAFLNAAVGQLYGEFSESVIKSHLAPPINTEPWHLSRLQLVVERAKEFFKDSDRVNKAYVASTGIDDEKDS